MSKIVELDVITTVPLPAERVLRRAGEADLETAVIVGWTKDGEFYFASTHSDGGEVIYLLERAKLELLNIGPEDL